MTHETYPASSLKLTPSKMLPAPAPCRGGASPAQATKSKSSNHLLFLFFCAVALTSLKS